MNLRSEDCALKGVLWESRGAWLVLREATLLKAQLPPAPIDGEAIVHRENIAFIQAL